MTIYECPECGRNEVIRDGKHLVETRVCYDCYNAISDELNGGYDSNGN